LLLAAVLVAFSTLPADAGEVTPGLESARAAAQKATEEFGEAESALGSLEQELERVRADRDAAQAELDGLKGQVREIAIERYTDGGSGAPIFEEDMNAQVRADALTRMVTQGDADTIDRFRAVKADLDASNAALEEKLGDQKELITTLDAKRERLQTELARLEELEQQRLAEERRRAEEAAREAAAAAERDKAQNQADQLAAQQQARDAGKEAAQSGDQGDGPVVNTPVQPVVSAPSGGGIVCPVPGSSFIDSWGAPRSGGRRHQGVDMMASTGTPVLAPASGTVSHRGNSLGGMSFHLNGDNGVYYYGTHLSAYGQAGHVSAGTVIGYVGDTGNARGTPHLHFEVHPNGVAVNPYPYVAAAC
jgi:murein DD-endopeptidase MepM/ murein hydrolase activator NlpD